MITLLCLALFGCGAGPFNSGAITLGRAAIVQDLDCDDFRVDDGTAEGHSSHLGCTGLYSNWSKRVLGPGVRPFTPAFSLWSDGAEKARWIYLPENERIDNGGEGRAGSMDSWVFPLGTKLWKQFSFGSRLVETRLLWKRSDGWFQATYLWSPDQSVALESTAAGGLLVEGADPDGPSYEIPSARACVQCHNGAADTVLGFETINLSAEGAAGLTLNVLGEEGLFTESPDLAYPIPGDEDARASLGWLHSNCGLACHNPRIQAGPQLQMRLQVADLARVEETDTWRTAVRRPAQYVPLSSRCSEIRSWQRIVPGDPDCSAVPYRAGVRDPISGPHVNQMPPLLSHRPPTDSVETLRRWIATLAD